MDSDNPRDESWDGMVRDWRERRVGRLTFKVFLWLAVGAAGYFLMAPFNLTDLW